MPWSAEVDGEQDNGHCNQDEILIFDDWEVI